MIDYDSWVDLVKGKGIRQSIADLIQTEAALDCLVSWYYAEGTSYVHAMALAYGETVRILVRGNGNLIPPKREDQIHLAEFRSELSALRVWTRDTYKISGSTRPAFVTVAEKGRNNDFEIARADFAPTIDGQRDRQLWALLDNRLMAELRKGAIDPKLGQLGEDVTRDRRKRLFAQEARKSLHLIWTAFNDLSTGPNNTKAVKEMLLGIEALKGNARGLGYTNLVETASQIESKLNDIRDGKITTSQSTKTLLSRLMKDLEQQTDDAMRAS